MLRREFLMLSHKGHEGRVKPDWFWSYKLDGVRAFWDGGISCGVPCSAIPWANTKKDGRYREERLATGMWSRLAKPIYIPGDWQKSLPKFCLDGELWGGVKTFQSTISTVKDLIPGDGWDQVRYMVFEIPALSQVFQVGRIPGIDLEIGPDALDWALKRKMFDRPCQYQFQEVEEFLRRNHPFFGTVRQTRLGDLTVEDVLEKAVRLGHEGIMLRDPTSIWNPQRSWSLIKVKKFEDDVGKVIGYTFGRRTEKGSKLLGMMGAMIVLWNGHIFELNGFTERERQLVGEDLERFSEELEGQRCPEQINNPLFPRGSPVRFKYNEVTDDGVPKVASYYR